MKIRLLLLALPFLLLVDSASAYTTVGTSGRPGRFVTVEQIQGSHFDQCGPAFGYKCYTQWLYQTGLTVSRSPRTRGTQNVYVTYKIFRWNGSQWSHHTTSQTNNSIGSGYRRAQLFGLNVLPTGGPGYFNVEIKVDWYDSSNNWLGTRHIDMSQSGDYTCRTTFPCSAGTGYVYLGGTYR
jgi:hypothetical protein